MVLSVASSKEKGEDTIIYILAVARSGCRRKLQRKVRSKVVALFCCGSYPEVGVGGGVVPIYVIVQGMNIRIKNTSLGG